VAKTVTK
jgi:pre-mRNA-processing factor 8